MPSHNEHDHNEARLESPWRLRIGLNVVSLSPPALQYAVFCEDPVPRFLADFKRVERTYQDRLDQIADSGQRETTRILQLNAVWNCLFRSVTGDEVYLLTPGTSTMLMSNAPAGKKWLVTKPVQVSGRTVSWSIPFEAAAEATGQIELMEGNALELAALIKRAVPEG